MLIRTTLRNVIIIRESALAGPLRRDPSHRRRRDLMTPQFFGGGAKDQGFLRQRTVEDIVGGRVFWGTEWGESEADRLLEQSEAFQSFHIHPVQITFQANNTGNTGRTLWNAAFGPRRSFCNDQCRHWDSAIAIEPSK